MFHVLFNFRFPRISIQNLGLQGLIIRPFHIASRTSVIGLFSCEKLLRICELIPLLGQHGLPSCNGVALASIVF